MKWTTQYELLVTEITSVVDCKHASPTTLTFSGQKNEEGLL